MSINEILARRHLVAIEPVLQRFIERRRWFSGRASRLATLTIFDIAELDAGGGHDDLVTLHVIVEARYEGGPGEKYAVPIGIWEGTGRAGSPEGLIAEVDDGARGRTLVDALATPESAVQFWALMAAQRRIRTARGELRGSSAAGLTIPGAGELRPNVTEQTNTGIIRGTTEFFKWVRELGPGPSIDTEMADALSAGGFTGLPPWLGAVDYVIGGGPTVRIGHLHRFLHHAVDAGSQAYASLAALASGTDASLTLAAERPGALAGHRNSFVSQATLLGALTCEMHLALASDRVPAPMSAYPADRTILNMWADEMTAELDALMSNDDLSELRPRRPALVAEIDAIRAIAGGGLATRIHGDFHLGQIFRADEGWYVLDFEGEPVRPAAERRRHSSPLRDVAGVIRAFDYIGEAVQAGQAERSDRRRDAVRRACAAWITLNKNAYWRGYVRRARGSALIPGGADALVMRRAFELQRAIAETRYEIRYRPGWVDIPLRFLRNAGAWP